MSWELIRPDGWAEPEMTFDCAWRIAVAGAGLVCVRHPRSTSPGNRAPGCSLPVALLCHVCAREALTVPSKFAWVTMCRRCRAIDLAIGREHDAPSATPYGMHSDPGGTLLGRETAAASGEVFARRCAFTRAEAERLDAAYPGPRSDDSHALWDGWVLAHPVSDEASGAAYARYVAEAHPWLADVEPRTRDVRWLTGLAALAVRSSSGLGPSWPE